jgi:hypothetical protein
MLCFASITRSFTNSSGEMPRLYHFVSLVLVISYSFLTSFDMRKLVTLTGYHTMGTEITVCIDQIYQLVFGFETFRMWYLRIQWTIWIDTLNLFQFLAFAAMECCISSSDMWQHNWWLVLDLSGRWIVATYSKCLRRILEAETSRSQILELSTLYHRATSKKNTDHNLICFPSL